MDGQRTTKALDAETLAESVSRAMRAAKESAECVDGSRQLPTNTLREAGSVEQVMEDAYNRCVFEHAMGTKKLITAKNFCEAVGEWGGALKARSAAFKLRFMGDIASGGKLGINLVVMPFMMKKLPSQEECAAWHKMWDSDAPFTNIVAETFDPADFRWDINPNIIHTTSPKQPIMFAAAVALKLRDKEGEAKEEDPAAMD